MIRVGVGGRRHAKTWALVSLASAAAGMVAMVGVGPAVAAKSGEGNVTVDGSWYQPNPTCQSPLGCVDLPIPSAYPADTIHVGVVAGIEESRSFVAIDIPQGKELESGVLTLPVDTALSRTPENAKLMACLATGNFSVEDQGATTASPTPLCDFSSPVEIEVPADPLDLERTMTVDLAPFLQTWTTEQRGILAIVPATDVAPTDAWHVAFSTPLREDPTGAAKPISAEFVLGGPEEAEEPDDSDEPTEAPIGDDDNGSISSGGTSFEAGPVAQEPELSMPETADPETADAPAATAEPAPVVAGGPMGLVGYRYPGVYLVPLLFALGLVWSTRAFTADLAQGRR